MLEFTRLHRGVWGIVGGVVAVATKFLGQDIYWLRVLRQVALTVAPGGTGKADRLLLPITFVYPVDHSALYRIVGLKIGWQAFQVTRDPAAV